MLVIYEGEWRLRGACEQGKGICVWEGHPWLSYLPSIGWFWRNEYNRSRTPKITWSISCSWGESLCMRLIRGLVLSVLAIPRHTVQSSKDRGWTQLTGSLQAAFQPNKPCIFSHSRTASLLWSSYCWWAIPAEGRQGKGGAIYYGIIHRVFWTS